MHECLVLRKRIYPVTLVQVCKTEWAEWVEWSFSNSLKTWLILMILSIS